MCLFEVGFFPQNKAKMQKVFLIFFIETGLLYKLIDKLRQINGLSVYYWSIQDLLMVQEQFLEARGR